MRLRDRGIERVIAREKEEFETQIEEQREREGRETRREREIGLHGMQREIKTSSHTENRERTSPHVSIKWLIYLICD